jgi:hypothetical protein
MREREERERERETESSEACNITRLITLTLSEEQIMKGHRGWRVL